MKTPMTSIKNAAMLLMLITTLSFGHRAFAKDAKDGVPVVLLPVEVLNVNGALRRQR